MKATILIIFMLYFFMDGQAQKTSDRNYHLLIGTYSSEGNVNGIHSYRFNIETGEFNTSVPVTELANASYLAVSKDRKNVYAVSEGNGGGSVNAFTFDAATGGLSFMNSVPSQGPCYVSVDDRRKAVFVGNYGGGSVLSVPLKADGSLGTNVQTIQHEGKSVVTDRQEKPHVHAVVLSPDNRYLLVPDLGTDKVYQYGVNVSETKMLEPATSPFVEVEPGGGPRHITFHPNGKYAYLVLELEASVAAFEYRNGNLTALQTIKMSAPEFEGKVSGADIHVSPDGKFLYASNRGDANEIAIYAIDKNGKLTVAGRQSVLGKTPRNFVIDPSGNFLLCANQNSNEVVIFRRDARSGLLTPAGKRISVQKPVCLKFSAIKKSN